MGHTRIRAPNPGPDFPRKRDTVLSRNTIRLPGLHPRRTIEFALRRHVQATS